MANTVTNTRILCNNTQVIQYVTIAYVDAQETGTIIYDSSVVATALGLPDTLHSKINSVFATISAANGNTAIPQVKLEWDASTKVLALSLPANECIKNDFRPIGGLKNTGGSGITGDITLTTLGLAAGDTLTLILNVDPR